MSEDRRKNLRTQGKYGDGKVQKSRDKKQKSSLGSKDSPEMRLPNKNSDDNRSANNSLTDENVSPLKYEENSDYTFHQLEEAAKPEEIKGRKDCILSNTDSGTSRTYVLPDIEVNEGTGTSCIMFSKGIEQLSLGAGHINVLEGPQRILYDPQFLHSDEGDNYFNILSDTVQFDSRNIVIHGVEYPQPRLVAWFGPFPYSYSGVTLEAAEMPDVVLEIKEKVEGYLKSRNIDATFNSVLINLYRDGKDSVSWHSDDEMTLGICPTIASVSLGETRKFEMRPKIRNHENKSPSDTTCKYVINLTHGSLVVMTGSMQDDWQHRVPKEYHDRTSRINLTFRTVYPLEETPERVPVKGINRESAMTAYGHCSSSISAKNEYKLDDEHFPSLQKDASSVKSNVTCDMNDNTDEKNWDSEISVCEYNIENNVAHKNPCSTFNKRDGDLKPNINGKSNLKNEKPPEKWHNIEPNCDDKKNPLDDKTATKKLWAEDYGYPENNTDEESFEIKCNKSINSSANEIEGNKFYEKNDLRNVCQREANLTVRSSQQNVLSQEECSLKSYNIKSNSYINVTQRYDMENEEHPNACHDVKSNSWGDSPESNLDMKRVVKMPLNVDAKAFTNSYINVTQENDLGRKPPNTCHYVESNSWRNSSEENNLVVKQPAKIALNVDAKEFIPNTIKSNEISQYSDLQLEDLIDCDVNLLQGKDLQDHAHYLKLQVLERFPEINRFERKDLEFLLEITDGSQTDKNQKLITQQICRIVNNNLLRNRLPSNAVSPFDRSSRQRGYDNQSYHSDKGKKYPTNQNRNPKYNRNRY